MGQSVMDFLSTAGAGTYPGAAFARKGHRIVGTVTEKPRIVTVKNDKNEDVQKLVVPIQAEEGTRGYQSPAKKKQAMKVGETYTLWVAPGDLAKKLKAALEEAGANGLGEGDHISVAFVDDLDTGKPEPVKLYEVKVAPAKPRVSMDALLDDDEDDLDDDEDDLDDDDDLD